MEVLLGLARVNGLISEWIIKIDHFLNFLVLYQQAILFSQRMKIWRPRNIELATRKQNWHARGYTFKSITCDCKIIRFSLCPFNCLVVLRKDSGLPPAAVNFYNSGIYLKVLTWCWNCWIDARNQSNSSSVVFWYFVMIVVPIDDLKTDNCYNWYQLMPSVSSLFKCDWYICIKGFQSLCYKLCLLSNPWFCGVIDNCVLK